MKKMIVAFAAAMIGIAANAATVTWSATNIAWADATKTDATGYMSYLINADTWTDSTQAFGKLLGGDTSAVLASVSGAAQGTSTTVFKSAATGMTIAGDWSSGDVLHSYLLIIDAATADKASHYMIAEPTNTTDVKFITGLLAKPTFGTQASNSWTAVPEPTSGLLLLLGMAGLALKRKQA